MCDHFIASVVIRLLSIQISPKRLRTHCGCLFQRISRRPVFRHDPISPPIRPYFWWLVLVVFYPPKGLLSLPCPSLLLLKRVISPSHHQRTSKTAHRHFFYSKNLRRGSGEAFTKRRWRKRQHLEKRKRDQDVIIPRSVSTFVAGEKKKATPAVRLSFYSLHKACKCVSLHKHTSTEIFL